MQEYECQQCKKTFRNYISDKSKYCSKECKVSSQVIDKTLGCLNCKATFVFERSGRAYNRRKYCSELCRSTAMSISKSGNTPWNKGLVFSAISGDKHWNWKGGSKRGVRGSEQRRFRKMVLERDEYTCTKCGAKDKPLIADHIKAYSKYPELREVVDNGRTLCEDCNYEVTYISKDWKIA